MAWYDDAYARRVPIVVDDRAGSGSRDVTAAVPSTLAEFWDSIQADGDDIRVTLDDGVTPVTYQWSGFTYATRTGSVQVDNATAPQSAMNVLWLYFGSASATSGAGSFTASSARTGIAAPSTPRRAPTLMAVTTAPFSLAPSTSARSASSMKGWMARRCRATSSGVRASLMASSATTATLTASTTGRAP